MKIGIFTDIYYPHLNGVSVGVDGLVKELKKNGHTVYLFAPKIKGYKDNDPNVFRLSSAKVIFSAPEIRLPIPIPNRSLRKVFELDLDLIHAHGSGSFSFLGYQIARIKGIPFILTFHGMLTEYTHYILRGKVIKPQTVVLLSRLFGNAADGLTTPSEKMKNILIDYGVQKPIKVIPNIVDLLTFDIPKKTFLHERLELPKDASIILSVGRLGKEKNFAFIIRMFKKLAEKEKTSHLVLVGEGPEKEKLVKLSGDLLNKRIHFAGEIGVEEMPLVYASAKIFVFTSVTETQGLCVMEAASSGLPLVLVDDSAYKNIIIDGINGFSLPQDQDIFAQKLEKLLEDKNLQKKFGENSREIIRKNFSPKLSGEEMITYYQKVIQSYKPSRIRKFNKATFSQIKKIGRVLHKIAYIEL